MENIKKKEEEYYRIMHEEGFREADLYLHNNPDLDFELKRIAREKSSELIKKAKEKDL